MSRRTEIQVGAMVLIALAILLWGVTWLKELSLARKTRVWLVHFEQTGGLAQSDEVQVNGIRKGSVQDVRLAADGVLVHLALDSDVNLTRDCVVAIRNVGLMGEKVISVSVKPTGLPYTDRDTIPGQFEMGIPEVVATLGPTVTTVNDLSRQLQSIADAVNQNGDLGKSMQNLRIASQELRGAVEENRRALKATIGNFQAASKTTRTLVTDRESDLQTALDHFQSSARKLDQLAGRLDSLRASIHAVSGRIENGQGTLGKLVNDEQVYDETRQTLAELKALIADVKAHPKKYFKFSVF